MPSRKYCSYKFIIIPRTCTGHGTEYRQRQIHDFFSPNVRGAFNFLCLIRRALALLAGHVVGVGGHGDGVIGRVGGRGLQCGAGVTTRGISHVFQCVNDGWPCGEVGCHVGRLVAMCDIRAHTGLFIYLKNTMYSHVVTQAHAVPEGHDVSQGHAVIKGNAVHQSHGVPQGHAVPECHAVPQGHAMPQGHAVPQGHALPE